MGVLRVEHGFKVMGNENMARKLPPINRPTPETLSLCADWVFAQTCVPLESQFEAWLQEEAYLEEKSFPETQIEVGFPSPPEKP